MDLKHNYLKNPFDLKKCKFLGEGHNGAVYMLPNGNAIKISYSNKDFVGEYSILEKVNGNKYFPIIYEIGVDYMIRECVQGEILSKYIKREGLNKVLALKMIDMLKEFNKLKFKKIDIRCKDIFVLEDLSLKIIDPKKFFSKERSFPKHLSKGLYKLEVLSYFQAVLQEYDFRLYRKWNKKINSYIKQLEK
jgi:hypothetical protein